MRIHGTFLNSSGLAVTVEIITRRDTLTSIEIGSDEAGLWFPASEAFTTESGLNDTFDVVLQSSATLRLETTDYRAEFYQRACRDAVVRVTVADGLPVQPSRVRPRSRCSALSCLLFSYR